MKVTRKTAINFKSNCIALLMESIINKYCNADMDTNDLYSGIYL